MTRFPSLYKTLKNKIGKHRLRKNEKGVAMIEFAMALPVLTILLKKSVSSIPSVPKYGFKSGP